MENTILEKVKQLRKIIPIIFLGFLTLLPKTIFADLNAPTEIVKTNIVFDFNSPEPVKSSLNNPINIIVGESRYEQKIRSDQKQKELKLSKNIKKREVINRESIDRTSGPSIEEKRSIVKEIAAKNSFDWRILEAVWEVESGKSWDRSVTSYAGAQGPMQFLPSTFRHYSAPGDNINSARDSLEAGAKLLSSAGAANGNVDKALFAYNHSTAYVTKVKRIASSITE